MADDDRGTFTDAPERSRYELHLGDELAGWVDYRPAGASIILAHTEVAEGHGGAGLGGRLVQGAVEAARADGHTVIAVCPFATAWLDRHPEFDADVVPARRPR